MQADKDLCAALCANSVNHCQPRQSLARFGPGEELSVLAAGRWPNRLQKACSLETPALRRLTSDVLTCHCSRSCHCSSAKQTLTHFLFFGRATRASHACRCWGTAHRLAGTECRWLLRNRSPTKSLLSY